MSGLLFISLFLGAGVRDEGLLDGEGVEPEPGLVRGQGEPVSEALGAGNAGHGIVGHLTRLGLGLEEGEVVEGSGPLVHENSPARQLALELSHPFSLLNSLVRSNLFLIQKQTCFIEYFIFESNFFLHL